MTNFDLDAHLEGTNRLRWCQMSLGGRCEKRIGACNKSASIQRLYVVLQSQLCPNLGRNVRIREHR